MRHPVQKPTWPKPNSKTEAALGRFIIAWNMLEQQMDLAIGEICRVNHSIGSSLTANLGTKAKLDIYQSLAHTWDDLIPEETISRIDRLAADTGNASGKLRNFIVHGQPFQISLPSGNVDFWAKFSARKGGIKGTGVSLTAEYIEKQTAQIKSLVDRWCDTRMEVRKSIDLLDHMGADLLEDFEDGGIHLEMRLREKPDPPKQPKKPRGKIV